MRFVSLIALGIVTSSPAVGDPLFVASNGTPSFSAAQCSGTANGSSPVTNSASCGAVGGTVAGSSFSTFGHIGGSAAASSASGNSLGNGISSEALFRDDLIFSSTNPAAIGADIQMSLFLQGIMDFVVSAGSAGDSVEGSVAFSGTVPSFFFFRFFNTSTDGFTIEQNPFSVTGVLGPTTNAQLTSPLFHVDFNSPVQMTLRLQASSSTGGNASASSNFGNSFALASNPFVLPEGVTVNSGNWLVDNRFIDPLAAVALVPEPGTWALMVFGFALMGVALRRSRKRAAYAV